MKETRLTLAEVMLIAGTRVMLGAGIGLLLASRLNSDQRKAAGIALAVAGAFTTIPLAMGVASRKTGELNEMRPAAQKEEHLSGRSRLCASGDWHLRDFRFSRHSGAIQP